MKQLAILGAGESGLGAALLAKREGYGVWVSDMGAISSARKEALIEAGIGFEEGGHDEAKILSSDLIIKSPGIPTKAPLVKSAMDQGIPVIDELEFAYRFSAGKVIAITGTNAVAPPGGCIASNRYITKMTTATVHAVISAKLLSR